MQEYNICYSLDSSYVEQLMVSITSILKNADVADNINIYILDGGLTKKDKNEIELLKNIKTFDIKYISVDKKDFENCPLLSKKDKKYKNYHVTLPTYYRFKLPELLPDLDKILYLDCDVIVRTSLKELYKLDISKKAVAMALDAESEKEAKRLGLSNYYNAGVMLINLDFWRKNGVVEKLFDYAKNNQDKILWQDQDIINSVLFDSIVKISELWNYQYFLYENIEKSSLSECNILHLAGRFKPWLMPFEHPVYEIYYYYLIYTAKSSKILEYKHNAFGKSLKNNIGGATTNILVSATNEDVQKIYDSITENYNYTNEQIDFANKLTDEKINSVYEVINNGNNFVKEQFENETKLTDEKISKVYEEITKNYDYTNELSEDLKKEIYSLNIGTESLLNNKLQEQYEQVESKNAAIYDEITKNYDFTKEKIEESKTNIEQSTDEKISKVYDEITKSYDFTKEKIEESKTNIEQSTDEKILKVYDEITKNYNYTNELSDDLKKEIYSLNIGTEGLLNKKIQETYDVISNNIQTTKTEVEQSTDEKISKVYDEITKNYNYTNELNQNLKNELNIQKNESENLLNIKVQEVKSYTEKNIEETKLKVEESTNEKISKVYDEITKSYDFTKEKIEESKINIEQSTDEKISKVYDEITKNYDYTNEKYQNVDNKLNLFEQVVSENLEKAKSTLNNDISTLKNQVDDEIKNIHDDIAKNNNYTEYLVQIAEEKQNQKREDTLKEINSSIDNLKIESDKKLIDSINNAKYSIEEKIKILDDVFSSKVDDLSTQINKETNHKVSEIYSYTNEQVSKLYKEVRENHSIVENTFNHKIYELYKVSDEIKWNIETIKDNVNSKINLETLNSSLNTIKQQIEERDLEYTQNILTMKNEFDDKLNQQRIKYENKLINMEQQINNLKESKKGLFAKLASKLKNQKKR